MSTPWDVGPVPGEDPPGAQEAVLVFALLLLAVAILILGMPEAKHGDARGLGRNLALQALVFAFATGCFLNALDGEFVYDDGVAVARNRDVVPARSSPSSLWSNNFWGEPIGKEASHLSYRPVTILSYRLTYTWFQPGMTQGEKGPEIAGAGAKGFHIVNVLCHGLSTLLFHRVASLFVRRPLRDWAPGSGARVSLLATLLFACHPVHVEAVANIVGHADVLAFLFGMVAVLCHLKACGMPLFSGSAPASFRPTGLGGLRSVWLLMQLFFCGVATLCKETGWTYYFVCVAADVAIICGMHPADVLQLFGSQGAPAAEGKKGKRPAAKTSTPSWMFWLIVRSAVTLACAFFALLQRLRVNWAAGNKADADFTWVVNPSEFITAWPSRAMTKAWYNTLHLWLMVFPRTLSNDWACASIPIVESASDIRNVGTGVAFATVVGLGLFGIVALVRGGGDAEAKKSDKRQATDGLMFADGLPLLALAMVILPLLPACHAFLTVGFTVAERLLYVPSSGFCLLAALLLHSLAGQRRPRRAVLFVLAVPLLAAYVGRTILRNRDWRNDMALFRSTTLSLPGNCKTRQSYAWALQRRWEDGSRDAEAEFHYRLAIDTHPGFKDPYINLGALLQRAERPQEAAATFYEAVQKGDEYLSDYDLILHLNLAFQTHRLDRLSEAASWYRASKTQWNYEKSPYVNDVERALADLSRRGL